MTLIKSISGIRGTVGGFPGKGLTPVDIVQFTAAFGIFLKERSGRDRLKLVVGRDARVSGEMVNHIVLGTLTAIGADVIDAGLSTTPTIEMAVIFSKADGGIILTASHNPSEWNALKLLNEKGEFLSAEDGNELQQIVDSGIMDFVFYDKIGVVEYDDSFINRHIDEILKLELVDVDAIRKNNFRIAIDCVNSTGGIAIPVLLERLGVRDVIRVYCEPNGNFPHNPEPLPENLGELSSIVHENSADLGFVVDPDVDRLAIVDEHGKMFGEEYTLVAVADYVLQYEPGDTVSNLSSTRALRDITEAAGYTYHTSAVGEVHVVEKMKEVNAVIGGEGNGGVIYPKLHYGRDALVGIALFLSYLAKTGKTCSSLRKIYPGYYISKNKIELTPDVDLNAILSVLGESYKDYPVSAIDGLKIEFEDGWVHLRKSNTEPVIRIYSEAGTEKAAGALAEDIIGQIKTILNL